MTCQREPIYSQHSISNIHLAETIVSFCNKIAVKAFNDCGNSAENQTAFKSSRAVQIQPSFLARAIHYEKFIFSSAD
jgi:hypothetical protein